MTAKVPVSTLKDRFVGRPAAVLGGGPSLPADMKRIPENSVLIAVNFHAFHYCHPDFMVYNDHPGNNTMMAKTIREHKTTHVSPEPTSDVIFDVPVWTGFFSSNTAAWFALWIGCDPVILCGMDCYQGEQKHCQPTSYDDGDMLKYPLDFYTRPWIEECRNSVPHPERLRAMSGPLVNIFGAYA